MPSALRTSLALATLPLLLAATAVSAKDGSPTGAVTDATDPGVAAVQRQAKGVVEHYHLRAHRVQCRHGDPER